MLLNELIRVAREHHAVFSSVTGGADVGWYDGNDAIHDAIEARVIEDTTLRAHRVQPAPSRLNAFLDGIQRAAVRYYAGPVPVAYAWGAAVVRGRFNGRMSAWREPLLAEREALFFPHRLLPRERLDDVGLGAYTMVDTSPPESEPVPLFPPALNARAAQAVNRWREGIERELAEQWCKCSSEDDWLLIDGSISRSPELTGQRRVAGLVKSHSTRFFDGEEARVWLGLQAGERTSVFEPQTWRLAPVHSWYLRLRDPAGHDLLWGLVRVEVPASRFSIEDADRISAWLLSEVQPLALPDSRWDRLLYPIHDCEVFLRARVPTW